MSEFKAGWYVTREQANGSRLCLYFRSTEAYTAACTIYPNGRQILTWQDAGGPTGAGKPHQWQATYAYLPDAPKGDWWENAASSSVYKPANPGSFSRSARTPTAKELSQRARAASADKASGLDCTKEIHVGVFFDGTNNNMDRDRPEKGHSNVVSLYDAHKDDKKEFFRYYIPGVGTKFSEIGEEAESNSAGNTYASGGEARIHYGMLQVFNAVCRAGTSADLMTPAEMKTLVTSVEGLRTWWRWSDDKMVDIFRTLDERLLRAVRGKRPKVTKVNVSVIGFSRGAAQARAFAQWLRRATGGTIGGAVFTLRFLGIFDTVASVALADSSPVGGSGFMDWADGSMEISGVERTVHFVAAHEIRRSFPLSTARAGSAWPTGVKEYVYPGAHSDVGGGYSPGEQGKSTEGRSALLAQIALNDMYQEALNAAVKLRTQTDMQAEVRADFTIDPALDKAFSAYAHWTAQYDEKQNVAAGGAPTENRMHYHTRLYWRWRAHVSADTRFKSLLSYTRANPQDRTDLWEAELDWRRDVSTAREVSVPTYDYVPTMIGPVRSAEPRSHASDEQRALLQQVAASDDVPEPVSHFFDCYVHDSHAGFWMLGPRTKLDKKELIDEIKARQAEHERLLKLAAEQGNPGRARNYRNQARAYELNQLERRVLEANAASPGSLPVFTDADAPALRSMAGVGVTVVLSMMGTATRREAAGHGRYRRVFDRS